MASTLNGLASISFILMVLISFAMKRFYSLCNIMQIFTMYSLFEVSLTVEISVFFKYLILVATFEIVDMGDYYESMFSFNSETGHSERFNIMSFDSTSWIMNMGFLCVIMVIVLLTYVIYSILWLTSGKHSKIVATYYNKLKKDLFWGSIILFMLEGYIDIILACMIWWHEKHSDTNLNGDYADYYLVLFFSGVAIILPVFSLIFLFYNKVTITQMARLQDGEDEDEMMDELQEEARLKEEAQKELMELRMQEE